MLRLVHREGVIDLADGDVDVRTGFGDSVADAFVSTLSVDECLDLLRELSLPD